MRDTTRFETKTVRAVRGTDKMVIAKWQKRGWELVTQDSGAVRSELTFRRRKRRVSGQVVGGVALLVACAVVISVGAMTESDEPVSDGPSASQSKRDEDTAYIDDLLAALKAGKLEDYYKDHSTDPIEFDADVLGVGPPALKRAGIVRVRAVVDGRAQGPVFEIIWGYSPIPFPEKLTAGSDVRVRANIYQMIDDDLMLLSPDDHGSFVRPRD